MSKFQQSDAVATYYEFYAGLAYSWEGEILQSDNVGENIYLHYAPIGVSVGICPWNFPFFVVRDCLLCYKFLSSRANVKVIET